MGVSVDSGGKGGKKSVNADLNLVPYIDLLTCMVAFLLITAVWSQLARLEAHQKGQGQAGEDTPPEKIVKLRGGGQRRGLQPRRRRGPAADPQARATQYDFEKLGTELKKFKDTHPDKTDIQVASEDAIKFEVLVRTMDMALTARFPDISLIDAGGAGI